MKTKLNGLWSYRSFRHDAIVVQDNKVQGKPELLLPWTPVGDFEVTTSEDEQVTATLTFGKGTAKPTVLKVAGRITQAAGPLPAAMEVTGEGSESHYQIKGFFVNDALIVGTVMCTANDVAGQPVGTAGPVVLVAGKR